MIERPKRSVTRFFIPLIDVLILLFCIFLLMPIYSQPGAGEPSTPTPLDKKDIEEPLPKDVETLQKQLQEARRDVKKLQDFRSNLGDRLSICVLEINPRTGSLRQYRDQKPVDIPDDRALKDVIDRHKRQSGTREPFILIRMPLEISPLSPKQLNDYERWLKAEDVPFRFDNPLGPAAP